MNTDPSMIGYCVACGNKSDKTRCAPCQIEFDAGGGVKRDELIREFPSGMRLVNIAFLGKALSKFCRYCGEAIDESRLRHSLLAYKRECYSCGNCRR